MSERRDINEYLDGRMSPARRAAFAQRLAADPALAGQVEETRRVLFLLGNQPESQAPLDLTARIMARTAELPIPRRKPGLIVLLTELLRPQRLAVAAVAAAVLFVVGVLARPETPTGNTVTAQLTANDRAFIDQALQDYHVESLRVTSPTGSGAEGTRELLGTEL